MKTYRFFYHYNKPLSQRIGKTMWSVHFRGTCFFAESIRCNVASESKTRKTQPRAVMQGYASFVMKNKNQILIS